MKYFVMALTIALAGCASTETTRVENVKAADGTCCSTTYNMDKAGGVPREYMAPTISGADSL